MTDDTTDPNGREQPGSGEQAGDDEAPDEEPPVDEGPAAEDEDPRADDGSPVGGEVANGGEPALVGEGTDGGSAADESTADQAVAEYLLKGALVMLVVLGVVATLQFYLAATRAITRMTTPEYGPLFHAAFNLVVLLAVGIGIAQVVRRLR